MNIRKLITPMLVEDIRSKLHVDLDGLVLDAEDTLTHERNQINLCLHLFVDFLKGSADTTDGGASDSLMLRSILERVTALADIIVTKDQFESKLDVLATKLNTLTDSNKALDQLVEQLVNGYKLLLTEASQPTPQIDFSAEAAKLDALTAQADSISASNSTTAADVNSALSSISSTVASAPVSTTPATSDPSQTPTPANPGIVNQTPAPINQPTQTVNVPVPVTASSTAGTSSAPDGTASSTSNS